jgi:hypothetical protein
MNHRRIIAAGLALVVFAAVSPAQLNVVKLKSGETVEGYVVEQTNAFIKIETLEGKTLRYPATDIASQEETARTGIPELDKKLGDIDRSNPDALAEVAGWAKDQKMRAWQLLAREVLKNDPNNEKANTILGHTKVGNRWYKSKSEADAARKAELEADMKAKGFIKLPGGWISKEDKPLYDKDKSAFELDDNGVYRDKATVMKERGLTLVKGKWVRGASPADAADMEEFRKVVGEEILIVQFDHFRLCMMNTDAKKIEELGNMCEKTYAWCLKEFGKPADYDIWQRRKATFWAIKDKKTRDAWLKAWRAKYGFDQATYDFFLNGSGNFYSSLLGCVVLENNDDIRNFLLHGIGHFMIDHFSHGLQGTPPWLHEAWGNYCEHVNLGAGHIACSTKSNYGGAGGVVDKGKFNTKDAKDRCRGIIREGNAEPMTNMSKLDLNSLTGDHLAKGWSVVEWMMNNRKKEFVEWLQGMNRASQEEALAAAISGWNFAKMDEEWEAYVKAKY